MAADLSTLEKAVSNNKTETQNGLDSLQGLIDSHKTEVQQYQTTNDATIESIENNIEAMDEEIHEPEILNAPIEIEGAFPSVLGGTFNDANLDEMYVWTYFVPNEGAHAIPFDKQAGMEHLDDLIHKITDKYKYFTDLNATITDLSKRIQTLEQQNAGS